MAAMWHRYFSDARAVLVCLLCRPVRNGPRAHARASLSSPSQTRLALRGQQLSCIPRWHRPTCAASPCWWRSARGACACMQPSDER